MVATRCASALVLSLLVAGVVPAAPVPPPAVEPLPKGATARLGSIAFGGYAQLPVFSADGKRVLATGHWELRSWDADTGMPLKTKQFHHPDKDRLAGLRFVVAGDRLIGMGGSEPEAKQKKTTVLVTDLDGVEVSRFSFDGWPSLGFHVHPPQMLQTAVTPDGKYLAVVPDKTKDLSVYDLTSGKRLHTHQFDSLRRAAVAVSADSKTVFGREEDKPFRRWDLTTGKELPGLEEVDDLVNWIETSPNGKRLVTRRQDKFLVVRDESGKAIGKLEVGGWPAAYRFAGPDAVLVVTTPGHFPGTEPHTLSRWNVTSFKREWELPCPAADRMEVSPDGKRVAVSHSMYPITSVHDAVTGKPAVPRPGHAGPIAWVGFTPDGKDVITAAVGEVAAWGLNGEQKKKASAPELNRTRWSPPVDCPPAGEGLVWFTHTDDRKVAEIVGWDREEMAVAWRVPLGGNNSPARSLFSHDGKQVLDVAWDSKQRTGEVTVYDGPTAKKLHEWRMTIPPPKDPRFPDPDWIPSLNLSPDGKILLAGGERVSGLDVATGKELWRVETGPVRGTTRLSPPLALSGDGSYLATIDSKSVQVFGGKAGKLLTRHAIEKSHDRIVAFDPDGRKVVVWSVGLTGVLVCDAESDAKPRLLDGGLTRPTCASFHPDGTKLVVGYQDGTALIWDLAAK